LGAQANGLNVTYALGTAMSTTSTSGFAAAIAAAKSADAIVYAGGIDLTIEKEALDRLNITWPGNQLDLISQLESVGKPLIVVQFGGGQLDDSSLKASKTVNSILWAGYPGQSGGQALFDIITGKASPAGRLPITQYPANYVSQVPMTDMTLRPSATNPGRTYKWYTGTPIFDFGFGLHFTSFTFSWSTKPKSTYNIQNLLRSAGRSSPLDLATFDTFSVNVKNTGKVASDYVALLFVSGTFGPSPHPNKELVSYTRLHSISPGKSSQAKLAITLGAISRTDENGDKWVYPGSYQVALDTTGELSFKFELQGSAATIATWPRDNSTSSN